jgi:hypothetical protein
MSPLRFLQLARLCSTPSIGVMRVPFLSLSNFNPAVNFPRPSQRRWYARKGSDSVAAKAGRKNIFLEPKESAGSSFAVGTRWKLVEGCDQSHLSHLSRQHC